MNKERKTKIRKLTAIIMLAITTLLCFSVFSACGEKAKYEAQVVFTLEYFDAINPRATAVATQEKNEVCIEYGLDTMDIPFFAKYEIVKVLGNKRTIEKSFYLYPNGETPQGNEMPFFTEDYHPLYYVTDEQGNKREGQIYIYYPLQIGHTHSTLLENSLIQPMMLENIAGTHRIEFWLPSYDESTKNEDGNRKLDLFSVEIEVKEDTRPIGTEIVVAPSSEEMRYTKISAEETGIYDLYIVETDSVKNGFDVSEFIFGRYIETKESVNSTRRMFKIEGNSNNLTTYSRYLENGIYYGELILMDVQGAYKTIRYKYFIVVKNAT